MVNTHQNLIVGEQHFPFLLIVKKVEVGAMNLFPPFWTSSMATNFNTYNPYSSRPPLSNKFQMLLGECVLIGAIFVQSTTGIENNQESRCLSEPALQK